MRKQLQGYINDSTYTNAGDPSTMRDGGNFRNSIYNYKVESLPDGFKKVKSKKPDDWDVDKPLNKCFYAFGSNTNIRQSFTKS